MFKIYLDTGARLYVFVEEMCRSVYFKADKKYSGNGKMETLKYIFPQENFDGVPGKVLDLSNCLKELVGQKVPFVLSMPHLMNAEMQVQNKIDGLTPSEKLHSSHCILEPNSGIILGKRLHMEYRLCSNPLFILMILVPKNEIPFNIS